MPDGENTPNDNNNAEMINNNIVTAVNNNNNNNENLDKIQTPTTSLNSTNRKKGLFSKMPNIPSPKFFKRKPLVTDEMISKNLFPFYIKVNYDKEQNDFTFAAGKDCININDNTTTTINEYLTQKNAEQIEGGSRKSRKNRKSRRNSNKKRRATRRQ